MRLLDLVGETIWIRFRHDEVVLSEVRALPERRFDRDQSAWAVPVHHFEVVVQRLEKLHFKFSQSFRRRWEELDVELDDAPDGWTISQVNERARAAIRSAFDGPIWVVGELQGFDKNGRSGHAYFELVERPRPNTEPKAKVNLVCFRQTRLMLAAKLRDLQEIEFRDGLQVRILARPTLYSEQGRFQLIMEDLDPHYTAGALHRRREAVIEAMRARGIARRNLELPFPVPPLRVALITSPTGDARRDFETELGESGYAFRVTVIPAAMQGARTEETVARALAWVAEHADRFDVVCLTRGGGSRSDLAFFDTEVIAEAVCRSPVKVVVGVGHQRDACALDSLATSAKTPTAAASVLVGEVVRVDERLRGLAERLVGSSAEKVVRATDRWRTAAYRVGVAVPRRLERGSTRLGEARHRLGESSRSMLRDSAYRVASAEEQLVTRPERTVERALARLRFVERGLDLDRLSRLLAGRGRDVERLRARLERAARNVVRESETELTSLQRAVRLVHPQRVVERGYALVVREGALVTDAAALERGARATLRMRDGKLEIEVTRETEESDDE